MGRKESLRIVITIVLLIIMSFTAFYLVKNRDKLFTSAYQITYPDRCVETFENDVLVSEECTIGREKLEKQQNQSTIIRPAINAQWNLNLT